MCDTEKLIEKVRGQPILYDLSNSEYKNIKKKDKIWDEIAMSIGATTGDELKKKWKNLRDSYNKYLRSKNTKTGKEMKIVDRYKTWPWAQQMDFLQSSLLLTKTHSNTASAEHQSVSKLTEEAYDQDQASQETVEKNHPPAEESHSSVENIDDSQQNGRKNRQQVDNNQQESKKIKQDKLHPPPSSVEQVISYLDRKTEDSTIDGIDDIFKGYAKIIKKFSKKRQAIVKFKISKLIMEEELAQLEEDEQHVNNRSTSSSPNSVQLPLLEKIKNEPSTPSVWNENFEIKME